VCARSVGGPLLKRDTGVPEERPRTKGGKAATQAEKGVSSEASAKKSLADRDSRIDARERASQADGKAGGLSPPIIKKRLRRGKNCQKKKKMGP